MTTVRELADDFNAKWLSTHPFDASYMGIPGFEDRVPDASEAGDQSWRSTVEDVLLEAQRHDHVELSGPDSVTLGCLVGLAEQEMADLDSAASEYVVTAMPFSGPAQLLAVAARTILTDPEAASDYLARLRASGPLIDQQTERLRTGAARGRLPVAPLVERAITWADRVLDATVPEALVVPQPPTGWDREEDWQQEREVLATEVVKPALGRWVQSIARARAPVTPGRPSRAFLPARRRCRLRTGDPFTHDSGPFRRKTAPNGTGRNRATGASRHRAWRCPRVARPWFGTGCPSCLCWYTAPSRSHGDSTEDRAPGRAEVGRGVP